MIDSISSSLSRNKTDADPEVNSNNTNTTASPLVTKASDPTLTYGINIDETSASMTLETNINSTLEILEATTRSLENRITATTEERQRPSAAISNTPSEINNYSLISRNSSLMENIANGNIKRGMADEKSLRETSLKIGSKGYPFLNDDSLLSKTTLPSSSGDEYSTNLVKSSHKFQNTSHQEHELLDRLKLSTTLTTSKTATSILKTTLPENETFDPTPTESSSPHNEMDVTSFTITKSSEENLDRTESYETNFNYENTLKKPFTRHKDKNAEKGKYTGTPK